MKKERIISIVLACAFLFSGCSQAADNTVESTSVSSVTETSVTSESSEITETTKAYEPFVFNPHVYSGKIAERVPQDYWNSFYNLCDALREGEKTFECSGQDAYYWATNPSVLCNFFPAAGAKVEGKSDDGSPAFENGT